jgi:hypothetical protein
MVMDIENVDFGKIIDNYENSFVENYDTWKSVVKHINGNIPMYIEQLDIKTKINDDNYPLYSYDDFCKDFKSELSIYFLTNEKLTIEAIQIIFDYLTMMKILDSIT